MNDNSERLPYHTTLRNPVFWYNDCLEGMFDAVLIHQDRDNGGSPTRIKNLELV